MTNSKKIACVFPGQGSQFVGMGKKMSQNFSEARQLFQEADETLGLSLSRMCFEGPIEELTLTQFTQPAILTHSVAVWKILKKETGVTPSFVAGHSLGEYSALVAAGALQFRDAVLAVMKRGTWMQEAVPAGQGGMLALVGTDETQAQAFCDEVKQKSGQSGVLSVANLNGGGQVVVAGHKTMCEWATTHGAELTSKPRKIIPLNVSAPFHCSLMKPAEHNLAGHLKGIHVSKLQCPYVANVDAAVHTDHEGIVGRLVQQVSSPVRWEQTVQNLLTKQGVTEFLEVGPGKVLCGLIKRIEKTANAEPQGGTYDVEP